MWKLYSSNECPQMQQMVRVDPLSKKYCGFMIMDVRWDKPMFVTKDGCCIYSTIKNIFNIFWRWMTDWSARKHRRELTIWQVFMSSREEISQPRIKPPTSSFRFRYLSTIIQQFRVILDLTVKIVNNKFFGDPHRSLKLEC